MPKVLHTVTVAFEIETDKISTLDSLIKAMKEAIELAAKRKADGLNRLGNSIVEVI